MGIKLIFSKIFLLLIFVHLSFEINIGEARLNKLEFNGNGNSDLLWQNENSRVVTVWSMNGTTIASTAFLTWVPSSWEIEQVADVNEDGKRMWFGRM